MESTRHIGRLEQGRTWGRYVILDHLGEGSMGMVYAAYDVRLQRRVALKLLHPESTHAPSSQARDRLLREAQAMARLSHPNVVAAYDADEIGGEVCLAMELVEGRTLRKWIEERPRSWREIVAAFVDAGRGLAAAHAVGVVHRDFKPDNVLIDRQGRVRVTDFSVAHPSLEPPPDASRAPAGPEAPDPNLTRTGALLGTPAYMAPEQLAGRHVDQRTDQFSFCVALYEALYRERPFAGETIQSLAFATAMEKVRPPARGSRVPPWLRRAILRGLSADPAHRHASMGELLDALQRDPARLWRRWGAAVAVMALALSGGGAIAAFRARSLELCRAGEQRLGGVWDETRQSRARSAFLASNLPYASDAWKGAKRALDQYVSGWLGMYRDSCEATHVRGEQSGELLDLRMLCLDRRRQELRALVDLFGAADSKTVENAVRASQVLTPLSTCADVASLKARGGPPKDPAARKRVEDLHAELARIKALADSGKYGDALPLAEVTVETGRKIGDPALLAEALLALGRATVGISQYKRAEAILHEAGAAAVAGHDEKTLAEALLEQILVVGETQRRFDEAHRWSEYARAAIAALGSAQGALDAVLVCNRSRLFRAEGKYDEAVREAEKCIALKEQVFGPDDLAVAAALKVLTQAYIELGAYARAAQQAGKAAAALERLVGPRHLLLAGALEQRGVALADMKDPEAVPVLQRARAIREAVLGPDHSTVAQTDSNLAMALIQLGRIDEGLQLFQRVLGIYERTYGKASWKVYFALSWIAEGQRRRGDVKAALKTAQRDLGVAIQVLGPDHPDLADPLLTEGKALLATRAPARAIPKLERSLALREAANVAPYMKAESAFALARALTAGGRDRRRALELAERARQLFREQGMGYEGELREVERWLGQRPRALR